MIGTRLGRYADHGLLILRVGFGLGFVWYHGWPKLSGGPERWAGIGGAMDHLGVGGVPVAFGFLAAAAETFGGLCLALGLFFRPAALAVALVMFVATIQHYVTGQGTPAHAFKNFWVAAGLIAIGPGRFSLDHLLARRRDGRE